jgi:hypothetical protein
LPQSASSPVSFTGESLAEVQAGKSPATNPTKASSGPAQAPTALPPDRLEAHEKGEKPKRKS